MAKIFDPTFGKTGFPLRLFLLRFRGRRLSQSAFADRFGLSAGMIRDVEQGRVKPSRALRVLVELIDHDPARVADAAMRAGTANHVRSPLNECVEHSAKDGAKCPTNTETRKIDE